LTNGKSTLRSFSILETIKVIKLVYRQWGTMPWAKYYCYKWFPWAIGILYTIQILAVSYTFYTIVHNGEIIGFGGLELYKRPKTARAKFYTLIEWLLTIFMPFKHKIEWVRETDNIIPQDFRNPRTAALSLVLIDEKYRGYGFGRLLLEQIEKDCQSSAIKWLYIETYAHSCDVGFYPALGYKNLVTIEEDGFRAFVYGKEVC